MVHHGEFLRVQSKDHHLVYHLERHWPDANLDDRDVALLTFVEKLNSHPGKISQEDVDSLRGAGFDERGALDIVLITSLFNFMNRLADGVGIRAQDNFRQLKTRHDDDVEAELKGGKKAAGD